MRAPLHRPDCHPRPPTCRVRAIFEWAKIKTAGLN